MTNNIEELEPFEQKKKKKPVFLWILCAIILILIVALGGVVWFYFDSLKAVQNTSEEIKVKVELDDSWQSISNKLEEQGVIKSGKMAYYYTKLNKVGDLYMGTYILDKSWNVDKIFHILNDPEAAIPDTVSVTLVEGDWAKHMAQKLSEVTNVSADDYISLWKNKEWIKSVMKDYPFLTDEIFNDDSRIYLEGYLAPDTYQFKAETTAEDVTRKILDQSLVVYNQYKDEIEKSDLSIHEIYTLASIVQYEAGGSKEDQKLIAGVFYNRLAIDMPLQSSVTVCYAIDYDSSTDNWQACEVNVDVDSPYNTYQNTGLTPGPIENAGVDVIDSVLNPTESNYLFFMADVYGDGTVYYAETEEEHYANVAKYLGE